MVLQAIAQADDLSWDQVLKVPLASMTTAETPD
jgi:hypothetical protein